MGLAVPGVETRATATMTFTLKVDGAALPGSLNIASIDISREVNRIPTATVVLFDGDAAKQDFEVSTGDLLTPGKTLEIEGGYSRDESLLFRGVITGQRVRVKGRGESFLEVEARDAAFRMALNRKSRYFTELTDSDLFEELIHGVSPAYPDLSPDVTSTTAVHAEIVQYQVTDWDLLCARAETLGMYVAAIDGQVRVGPPDLAQEVAATLAFGRNVLDLDLALDARTQVERVTASAWDPANQEMIRSEVEDVPAPEQGSQSAGDLAEVSGVQESAIRHSGPVLQAELDSWAQAHMQRSRFARIRGTVRFQGSEKVLPGTLVKLEGMGERFNGVAFVAGVRHALGRGDWESVAQLGLRPEWRHELFPSALAAPAAGLHPAINGLHVGVVTQLQDDPAGHDRILVRVPAIDAAADGVWSRLATLDAGAERGSFFRPEIGDEVIVGFINDDPHYPVVLGGLHSSSKPAPGPASDDNHEKGLVTRSKMKVVFNDDAVTLTIETPNGERVTIDDKGKAITIEDETGNKVSLTQSAITLESPRDIVLKASGDVSIEGTNVALKASAAVKVEGSGSASVKSSGTTEVRGSLVKIN
jgi:Rhs element Vgr protein